MFKKLMASGFALVLTMLTVSTSVFAATNDVATTAAPTTLEVTATATSATYTQQAALLIIEKANSLIDQKIAAAVTAADTLQAKYLADIKDADAAKTAELTEQYNKELNVIITTLYDETLAISNTTIKIVAELGVKAECSWVLVKLADQYVWIDPINVTM
jgi:hypothetical protein